MDFFNNVKGTVCNVMETMSNMAQNYVDRNRTKAKLNRLRMVMKSESELMNRAYIALGKEYYEMLKTGKTAATERQQNLVKVIDNSKAKIGRARDCYRKILENENEFLISTSTENTEYNAQDVQDITVACSNESDYQSSPFPAADPAPKAEPQAQEQPPKAEPQTREQPQAQEQPQKASPQTEEEAPSGELF